MRWSVSWKSSTVENLPFKGWRWRSLKSTAENFVSMVAEFGERSIHAWVGAGVVSVLPGYQEHPFWCVYDCSGRLIRNENVQYFNEVLLIDILLSQNNLSGVTPLGDGL